MSKHGAKKTVYNSISAREVCKDVWKFACFRTFGRTSELASLWKSWKIRKLVITKYRTCANGLGHGLLTLFYSGAAKVSPSVVEEGRHSQGSNFLSWSEAMCSEWEKPETESLPGKPEFPIKLQVCVIENHQTLYLKASVTSSLVLFLTKPEVFRKFSESLSEFLTKQSKPSWIKMSSSFIKSNCQQFFD